MLKAVLYVLMIADGPTDLELHFAEPDAIYTSLEECEQEAEKYRKSPERDWAYCTDFYRQ